jgi:hypothetical protein
VEEASKDPGGADFVPFEVCGFFLGMRSQTAEFPKTGNSALRCEIEVSRIISASWYGFSKAAKMYKFTERSR